MTVHDRRRFRLVSFVCVYSNTVLAGKREMGKGAMQEGAVGGGGGSGVGQLTLSKDQQGWRFAAMFEEPQFHVRGFFSSK